MRSCTNKPPGCPGDTCSRSGDTGHAAMIRLFIDTLLPNGSTAYPPCEDDVLILQGLGTMLKYYSAVVASTRLLSQYCINMPVITVNVNTCVMNVKACKLGALNTRRCHRVFYPWQSPWIRCRLAYNSTHKLQLIIISAFEWLDTTKSAATTPQVTGVNCRFSVLRP